MYSAATIPYHLRPLKAIERNLFSILLKKLDRYSRIDISKYQYIGFGAPFFEDFKMMHLDFGITKMHCIEYDNSAFTRQVFNKPYYFIKLFNMPCTEYMSTSFNYSGKKLIWLDFASPRELAQQLTDIELTARNLDNLDIVKFTFNANLLAYGCRDNFEKFLDKLSSEPTFQLYIPDTITTRDIAEDFPAVIRAMAVRAVKRGISASGRELNFNHLVSFNYADGQLMTTVTGIITGSDVFSEILKQSQLSKWEFYESIPGNEILKGHEILAPVMTFEERKAVDKLIPHRDLKRLCQKIKFTLDRDEEINFKLIEGYYKYYKYLPSFSKITF